MFTYTLTIIYFIYIAIWNLINIIMIKIDSNVDVLDKVSSIRKATVLLSDRPVWQTLAESSQ